jgi:hypothetical protein
VRGNHFRLLRRKAARADWLGSVRLPFPAKKTAGALPPLPFSFFSATPVLCQGFSTFLASAVRTDYADAGTVAAQNALIPVFIISLGRPGRCFRRSGRFRRLPAVVFRKNAFIRLSAFPAFAVRADHTDAGAVAAQNAFIPVFIFIKDDFRHVFLRFLIDAFSYDVLLKKSKRFFADAFVSP